MIVVALDFETANYPRDSAIALGLSVLEDGHVRETRSWLFRPPGKNIYIREDFIDIHGIRPADLKDKPYFDGVWQHIAPYLEKASLLIAHNAGFDRSVLYAVAERYGITLPVFNWQCTVNIARRTWPGLANHKLPTVCGHLGIELKHHDPASDAEACSRIFLSSQGQVAHEPMESVPEETPEQAVILAQYRLGLRYHSGRDLPQSPAKARFWLQKAAAQGHAEAQQLLDEISA